MSAIILAFSNPQKKDNFSALLTNVENESCSVLPSCWRLGASHLVPS